MLFLFHVSEQNWPQGQRTMVSLWLCTLRARAKLFPEVGLGFLPEQMWGQLIQEKEDSLYQDLPSQLGKGETNLLSRGAKAWRVHLQAVFCRVESPTDTHIPVPESMGM